MEKEGGKGGRGRKGHRDHERPTEKESKSDTDTEKHRKTKRYQEIPRKLSETNKRAMPLSMQIKWKVNGEQAHPTALRVIKKKTLDGGIES